jgi:hypothetical protein
VFRGILAEPSRREEGVGLTKIEKDSGELRFWAKEGGKMLGIIIQDEGPGGCIGCLDLLGILFLFLFCTGGIKCNNSKGSEKPRVVLEVGVPEITP